MRRRSEQLMPVSSSTSAVPTMVERISARAVEADSPLVMPASSNASTMRPKNAGPDPASAVAASNSRSSSVTTVPSCPSQPSTRASALGARERATREAERARADLDPDVRHAAEERHALLEHVLERRRGDAGRDRDDGGAGVDQLRGLAQHALDVDRLDGDQHDVGAAHELGVVGDVLDAQALGQARRPPRAAIGDEDALGQRRVGAQPALDHRAGHVAGADRAQYGRVVHASDGTCARLTGTQARWLGYAACPTRLRPAAASAAP